MSFDGEKLFKLLPALYRLRDAQSAPLNPTDAAQLAVLQSLPAASLTVVQQTQLEQLLASSRGPLQALMMLVAEQLAALEEDLDQLYDDQFIETCANWVIPYIGDLIGYQSIKGVAPAVASPRAEVANTISFRRRKGTALVLEQLARDITGWSAHAVEFFLRLADTQYMNHIRLHDHYAPDLRRWEPRVYMDSGFDATAHTVDIRRIAVARGRYNIQNVGIFLWSLNAYSLTMSSLTPLTAAPQCFRFSPLGRDMELFTNPISQGADITAPAQPFNVADRLQRHVLCRDLEQIQAKNAPGLYYGVGKSLALYVDGVLKNKIQVCDLSGTDGHWANLPSGTSYPYDAAIDPHLGRIALPPVAGSSPNVQVSFYYGFNADLGGGEYPRASTFTGTAAQVVVHVTKTPTTSTDFTDIHSALSALPGDGVVEIADSNVYLEPGLTVTVKPGGHIELRGRDGCRPVLILSGEIVVTGANGAFDLNGLLVTSAIAPLVSAPASTLPTALIHVEAPGPAGSPQLSHLGVKHCTLVPGWALTPQGDPVYGAQPVLIAEPAALQVVIDKSILGGMWISETATANVADSIVDATGRTAVAYAALDGTKGGGALTLQSCTVIGKVHATLLSLVSDSIVWAGWATADTWAGPLWADRKQEGCVRFSYVPAGSVIPRQFECVVEGYGTSFKAWAASTITAVGQLISATASGATFVYRCTVGGTTGSSPPNFSAVHGSIVTDGTAANGVTWQNVGTLGITPGPLFTSLRYGDPGYAKLLAQTDDSIRRGADDGGEMGGFHFVLAPQRETDLRVRLQEYLPVGLEFGIFYET